MVGHLVLEEARGRRPWLEPIRAGGLRLLRARVPVTAKLRPQALEKRLVRAAQALYREGVRRMLAPPGFPRWDILESCRLKPVDPAPLCQALAAPLALVLLEQRGIPPAQAGIALRGARVSRPLFRAAEALCPRVRRLTVAAGEEGAGLARWLREEYGAAVVEEGTGPLPHVTVDFFPREGCPPGEFRLYGPVPDLAGLTLWAEAVPALDAEPLPLLALLWEAGCVPGKEIKIRPLEAGRN